MPRCGSQVILCDIPIRFDTYKGCGHGCSYCFVSRKTDIKHIQTEETAGAWKAMEQSTIKAIALKNASYADKIMQATSSPYSYIEGAKPLPKEKQDFVRAYFKEAQKKAGVKAKDIDECLGSYMWGHYTARVQFELPTYEAYEKLMTILPSLVPYPQLLAKLGMKERKPTTIFGAKQR